MILRRETNIYDDEAIKNSIASVEKKFSATYGTCSTAASTVAKVVTLEDFVLFKGAQISVHFTYNNTASSPTLNVNGTGAKTIWARGAAIAATYYWSANSTHTFTYDGTHWVLDNAESQEEVFNRLTNNDTNSGLYIENGSLYLKADYIRSGKISADYIYGGKLTLGGANNGNGLQVVYDANGNEIGRWDKDGLSASGNLIIKSKYAELFSGTAKAFTYGLVQGIEVNNVNGVISKSYISNSLTSIRTWTARAGGMHSTCEATKCSSYARVIAVGLNDLEDITASDWNGGIVEIINSGYYQVRVRKLISDTSTFASLVVSSSEVLIGADYPNTGKTRVYALSSGIGMANGTQQISATSTQCALVVSSSIALRYYSSYWTIAGANQSGNIATQSSSSKRYKHEITSKIDAKLNADNLYKLQMKQFKYNDNFDHLQYMDMKGQIIPGFIAEDVAEIYPAAVIHDADGNIESWDERRIIPAMLKLIQEQHEEIAKLKQVIHVA